MRSSTLVTGQAEVGDQPGRAAGGDQLDAGLVQAAGEVLEPGLVVDGDQGPLDRDPVAGWSALVLSVMADPHLPVGDGEAFAGDPAHGVDEHRPLGDLDPLVQDVDVVVVLHGHDGLRDDRPGVDPLVDDEQRRAGDLDPVGERVRRARAYRGTTGHSAGWVLTTRPANRPRNSGPTSFMKPASTTRSGSKAAHGVGQRGVPVARGW